MRTFFSDPVWVVFKRKLQERYGELSPEDLAWIERDEQGWSERLQDVLHRSPIEIAHLVDEVMDQQPAHQLEHASS